MKGTEVDREQRLRALLVLGLSGDGRAYGEFLTALTPRDPSLAQELAEADRILKIVIKEK